VTVRCAETRADMRVEDPLTSKSVSRSIDLAGTAPIARPHLLGLSIVELISASWFELASDAPAAGPQEAPAARQAARAVVEQRVARPRTQRLAATAAALAFPRAPLCWGGGLAAGGELRGWFGWSADATFARGERGTPLGSVLVDTASGAVSALARVRR